MTSPTELESLLVLLDKSSQIKDSIDYLNKRLINLVEEIGRDLQRDSDPNDAIDSEEIARLNHNLERLESFLSDLTIKIEPELLKKVANPDDPMGDYEIKANLQYTLREDDNDWCADSDNFLVCRSEMLGKRKRTPFCKALKGDPGSGHEQHCWLFRDLYDHHYDLARHRITLKDCLRLGEVWVDVIIRQQYWFNLDSGQWNKVV